MMIEVGMVLQVRSKPYKQLIQRIKQKGQHERKIFRNIHK